MDKYKVSIIVVTYESDYQALVMTLKSILFQKDIDFEIILCDDGSKENHFEKVEELFSKMSFSDYQLLAAPVNQGTVKNIQMGLSAAKGYYIKTIGPGDLFYQENSLVQWIAYMEENHFDLTFADVACVVAKEGQMVPARRFARPQRKENEDLREYYMLMNDSGFGAAVLGERLSYIKYMNMISGKVIYAEDMVIRLMFLDQVPIGYFDEITIYYELGSGISTCKSEKWDRLLKKDWQETDQLLLERIQERLQDPNLRHDQRFGRQLQTNIICRNDGSLMARVKMYWSAKKMFLYKLRRSFSQRYTSDEFSMAFYNQCK